jgi:hypothetical protein
LCERLTDAATRCSVGTVRDELDAKARDESRRKGSRMGTAVAWLAVPVLWGLLLYPVTWGLGVAERREWGSEAGRWWGA